MAEKSGLDDEFIIDNINSDSDAQDQADEEEEDYVIPSFGPAALGLHRVGTVLPPKPTPSEPVQKLNARGMPARIRKKNRFFVDDFIDSSPISRQSPKRQPKILSKSPTKTPNKVKSSKSEVKPTPLKNEMRSDKQAGHLIGMRLRNLLKLPKAHKWVCFEYFYSNIDKVLFDGENDFITCLKESFPQLTSRKLTQVQWSKIRRMMGKPRRCSQAFFAEERKELEIKRKIIRYIQQRKSIDLAVKDMPNEIPMQLVVGTKVTARLRKPQDGLFTGHIDAVDTLSNTYRITFERPNLGTHSVPDYEVLSNEPPDTISLSSLEHKFRPKNVMQEIMNLCEPEEAKMEDSSLTGFNNSVPNTTTSVAGYPIKILQLIVKLSKVLKAKKLKVDLLSDFNTEAEKKKSLGFKLTEEFQKKYAATVIELEKMNIDIQEYINEVQFYCHDIAPGASAAAMLAPSLLRDKCREESNELFNKNNNNSLKDPKVVELIKGLISILLQVKTLSDSDQNAYELSILQGSMEQIKSQLDPQHRELFRNNIEIHMQRIQMSLGSI